MTTFACQLQRIKEQIAGAAFRSTRRPEEVSLVAVSKGHPSEAIRAAAEAGVHLFGESRVQEAREKIASAPKESRWHFIGHLQRNKVRQALPSFEMIESVDSLELARAMDRVAGELGITMRVLFEVNIGGEPSKHGFLPNELRCYIESLLTLTNLEVRGLMTIPPAAEAEAARPYFAALRELRDELSRASGHPLPELSMGMSGDFEVAIEEGATIVRIGTALFGVRRSVM